MENEEQIKISKTPKKKRKKRTGVPHTEETKKKLSEMKKGVPKTAEHRKNLSEAVKGRVKTKKHKRKIAASANRIVTCPHCGATGKSIVIKRTHFDKCEHFNQDNLPKE